MSAFKTISFLSTLILSGCVSNPYVSKEETNKSLNNNLELVKDKESYFKAIKKEDSIKYLTQVDDYYFDVGDMNLRPVGILDKKGFISIDKSELSEASLFKYLTNNFGDNVHLEDGVFTNVGFKDDVEYEGTTRGVLDYMCHIYDCSWSYDDYKGLRISKFEVKQWSIPFMPVSYQLNVDTSSNSQAGSTGGSGEGASGRGGQNLLVKNKEIDLFTELEETVKELLSDDGKLSVQRGLGYVTVKYKPSAIARIDEFMEDVTRNLSTDIAFYIDVFQVQVSDVAELGLELNQIYSDMGNGVTWGNQVGTLLNPLSDNLGLGVTDTTSRFYGSSAFLQMVKEKLNIVNHYQKSAITRNRKATVISNIENYPYEEVNVSAVPNVSVISSSTIEEKPVGTSISLLPVLINKNQIALQFNFSGSEVVGEYRRIAIGEGDSVTYPLTGDNKRMSEFTLTNNIPLVVTSDVNTLIKSGKKSLSKSDTEEYNALLVIVTANIRG